MPCPCGAGARADVDRAVRTRCAPVRSRTARRRCPRHSLQRRGRDSGPAAAPRAGAARNAARPPIACSALSMRAGEVAAVIDDRLAVAIGQAHGDRASRSAWIMLRRLTSVGSRPSVVRDQVHGPLHGEGRLRPAGATIGRVRHLVGRHDARRRGEVRDLVGTGQMDGGVVGDARRRSDSTPRNRRGTSSRKASDVAVGVEADLDLVQLVARMAGAQQMLLPLLDPAHRAPDRAGQERDQQVLGVDVALGAEAAADIERHAADPRLGQPQERGGRPAHPVHHLRRRPDRDRIGALVVGARSRRGTPSGIAGIAMVIEAAPKPMRRGGERRRDVAFLDGELADQVGRVLFVERSPCPARSAASGSTTAGSGSRSTATSSAASRA